MTGQQNKQSWQYMNWKTNLSLVAFYHWLSSGIGRYPSRNWNPWSHSWLYPAWSAGLPAVRERNPGSGALPNSGTGQGPYIPYQNRSGALPYTGTGNGALYPIPEQVRGSRPHIGTGQGPYIPQRNRSGAYIPHLNR
jgi:hypothetical protein